MVKMSSLIIIDEILTKGSEAYLYTGNYLDKSILVKHRKRKSYRHSTLDKRLRKQRTKREARLSVEARYLNIPVPKIFGIIDQYSLIIERIDGQTLGQNITNGQLTQNEIIQFFIQVGRYTGVLHNNEIVHGDLTIFNCLIDKEKLLWLIDFGLSYNSIELEHLGSDLNTFMDSLKAYHPNSFIEWSNAFLKGYRETSLNNKNILEQLKSITSRGRYH